MYQYLTKQNIGLLFGAVAVTTAIALSTQFGNAGNKKMLISCELSGKTNLVSKSFAPEICSQIIEQHSAKIIDKGDINKIAMVHKDDKIATLEIFILSKFSADMKVTVGTGTQWSKSQQISQPVIQIDASDVSLEDASVQNIVNSFASIVIQN